MAYRNGEMMRLYEARDLGVNPSSILDIGAHSGQFYSWAKAVWYNSFIFMIEANPLHENALINITNNVKDEYLIAALGDGER